MTSTARPAVVLAMEHDVATALFDQAARHRLARSAVVDPQTVVDDFADPAHAPALAGVEILLTGWGCPRLDAAALQTMPRLRAVIHAAGSVKHHLTDACWERGLVVSSAAAANALPVAEYTIAAILFGGKRVVEISRRFAGSRRYEDWNARYPGFGNYRRTVGVIGASLIGRRVIELLQPYDLEILVADPYLDAETAQGLGARLTGLDELLAASDIVTVHAPELPETRHMLDRNRLGLLRDGATLINTARGSLVDTAALTKELVAGRLHAVLDVTDPEPLPTDSPLYDLPNVLLTPHIAGSLGGELHRMAESALDELDRYAAGLAFAHPVTPGALLRSA
jgi:phosphoglycerate dehydrogenase-like enzyme